MTTFPTASLSCNTMGCRPGCWIGRNPRSSRRSLRLKRTCCTATGRRSRMPASGLAPASLNQSQALAPLLYSLNSGAILPVLAPAFYGRYTPREVVAAMAVDRATFGCRSSASRSRLTEAQRHSSDLPATKNGCGSSASPSTASARTRRRDSPGTPGLRQASTELALVGYQATWRRPSRTAARVQ